MIVIFFSIASPFASKLCMAEKNVFREVASMTDTQVAIDVWTTAHDQIRIRVNEVRAGETSE